MERSGKKGDTKTTYSVLPEAQLTDAQVEKVKAAKPHDLDKAKGDEGDTSTDMNSHGKAAPKGDALITPEQSAGLVARLKVLPREKLTAFLQKFGVAQIKALKASDLPAAVTMIDDFEGKAAAPAAAPAEADPFA